MNFKKSKVKTIINFFLILFLISPTTSITINCSFKITSDDSVVNAYTCEVDAAINSNSPLIKLEGISGAQAVGKSTNDVKRFIANSRNMRYIPIGFSDFFKNLESLKIVNGRLLEIRQENFATMTNLKNLNLDKNDIEKLDDNLFKFNPKIEKLWFEHNKIKVIGMTAMSNLRALNDLDLSSNLCGKIRVKGRNEVKSFLLKLADLCPTGGDWRENLKLISNDGLKLEIDNCKKEMNLTKLEVESIKNQGNLMIENLKNQTIKLKSEKQKLSEEIDEEKTKNLDMNSKNEELLSKVNSQARN